jgi:phenylalanyl-tRNA synthetase alpha chain
MDLTINERVVLKELGGQEATANEIAVRTGLKVDAVTQASAMLADKGLALVRDEVETEYVLTEEGRKYADLGLPERVVHDALPDRGLSLDDLKKTFPPGVVNIAMGWLRQKGWAKFEKRDGQTIIPPAARIRPDEKTLEAIVLTSPPRP